MLNKLTKIKRLLLIGKEIWHNKRSMRGRFIIYLLSLVLLAGSAMLILLNIIGIVQPPSHDIDRFLEYELKHPYQRYQTPDERAGCAQYRFVAAAAE